MLLGTLILTIAGLCLFAGALIWRVRASRKEAAKGPGTDEAFHYYYIDLIRKNGRKIPAINSKVIAGAAHCSYPAFYHWALSCLPDVMVRRVAPYLGIVYDLMGAFAVSAALYAVGAFDGLLMWSGPLLLSALYLVFPAFIFPSIGPRSFSLTPRNVSQVLICFAFIFVVLFASYQHFLFLHLSALCAACSALSSKFSVQYLVGVCVVIAVMQMSMTPVIYLVNAFLWALLLGRRQFIRQLVGQYRHSVWYIRRGLLFIGVRWQWKSLAGLLMQARMRDAWQIVMFHNPVSRGGILNFPVFVFLAAQAVQGNWTFPCVLIAASLCLWVLTQFSVFRAFGEPERYIEFSLPAYLYGIFLLPQGEALAHVAFASLHCLVFLLYAARVYGRFGVTAADREGAVLRTYLADGPHKRMLCTNNNETYRFLGTDDSFLVGGFVNNIDNAHINRLFSVYPDVNPDFLQDYCDAHAISHVIINKERKLAAAYVLDGYTIGYEGEIYRVMVRGN